MAYNSGAEYVVAKGGATLYAVWETNPTISYNSNEGTGSTVTEYYKKGSKVTLKSTSFTKTGHTLSGWSTTPDGSISYTIGQEITLNENLNLYAVWVENKDAVKITFNPGTGVSGEAKEINLVEGQSVILPSGNNLWSASNYTFKGWAESDGGEVKYDAGKSYSVSKNINLYAVWEKNKVTVTFISNGGNGSVAPITVNVGGTVTINGAQTSLTRDGYTFTGWGTTPDGKGGNVISGTLSMTVDSNLTFYAIWEENRNIKYYNGTTLVGVEYPTTDSVAIGDGNGLSQTGKALYWTIDSEGNDTSYDVGEKYTGTSSLVLYAQWQVDDGSLTYTLDTTSKTYSVKASNTSISGEIKIPETYKGKEVTAIEELGFAECKAIEKITIPDTVISIGGGAFYNCTSLKSVNIPDGITELKPYKEENGNYTTTKGLFGNCSKLTGIELSPSVTSIGDCSFVACLLLASVEIKGEVTAIGSSAFSSCFALESFTIPKSVTSIGEYAFCYSGIKGEIVLPENLVSIGSGAFGNCFNLTSVTIPSSVTSIGNYAFAVYSNLTISISNIDSGSWASILSEGMSQNSSYSVIIENGVTEIGTEFQKCTTITSISIPSSVTSIDSSAFSGCSKLTSIYVDNDTDAMTGVSPWGASSATVYWGYIGYGSAFTRTGQLMEIGTYPTSADEGSVGKAISWKALKVEAENNRALLISQDILEQRVFDVASENHNASSTYVGSDIQNYLKGDFLTTYGLSTTYMEKVDVTTDITTISESGTDYVFLLSKTEAEDPNYYFADNDARVANYGSSANRWWLRTGHGSDYVINVDPNGALGYNMTCGDTSGGVRPAFWYTWN